MKDFISGFVYRIVSHKHFLNLFLLFKLFNTISACPYVAFV